MHSSDAGRRRSRVLALATGVAILALAWQVSPVALWHTHFEQELSEIGDGERIHTPMRTRRSAPAAWAELRVANLSLRIPLGAADHRHCAACDQGCVLPLEGGGTVAVFDAPPPESLGETLDQFAPDAADLSIFRSVARNWQTIDALTDRVRAPGALPTAHRFQSPESRGAVTSFLVDGVARYVVYAYAPGGDATRVLGVTGVSDEDFDRILGSLRVSDGDERETSTGECRG